MEHCVSTKHDYTDDEVLEIYQALNEIIETKSSFYEILTEKIKEGKIVFSGSMNELLH